MGTKPKIEVYGSPICSYCSAAKIILEKKGLDYNDVVVSTDPAALAEMQRRSGHDSVPQIFINDRPIGGFDELYELEQNGQLDTLLGGAEKATGQ